MDKKEKKRDNAIFANMLKELMNKPFDDVLVTLDRDIQHFIYGRVALLVKHNEGKPIGNVADISAVVGAAFGDVLKEFIKGSNDKVDNTQLDALVQTARANLLEGFEARAPKPAPKTEEAATEETKETVENDT